MKKPGATPESLIQEQLGLCALALGECIESARAARTEGLGQRRASELESAAALLRASADLGNALARLRGEFRQTVTVERAPTQRERGEPRSGGSNGR